MSPARARAVRPPVAPPRTFRPAAPPDPPAIAKAGRYELHEDPQHDRYTTDERVLHYVTEGVQLKPYGQCRYAGGDSR